MSRKPSFITYLDKSILFAAVGVVIAAIVSQQGGGGVPPFCLLFCIPRSCLSSVY